jgi:hypothetical protein
MASYMEGYGVGDERRGKVIKYVALSLVAALLLGWLGYAVFHNYPERHVAKQFLTLLNEHNYRAAYAIWCPTTCEQYDYSRFLADWGANDKKAGSAWKIDSTDSCKAFLTVNVTADGAELQSLSVQRGTNVLSFAPAPECQEYKWHWKQFFNRILGR